MKILDMNELNYISGGSIIGWLFQIRFKGGSGGGGGGGGGAF